MKFMVGVDGSRIAQKAFKIAVKLMDKNTDELVVVNIYRVQKVGTYQFHVKARPQDMVPLDVTIDLREDGTCYYKDEEVILFIDTAPVNGVIGEVTEHTGQTNERYVGPIHMARNGERHEAVYHGQYSSDPVGRRQVHIREREPFPGVRHGDNHPVKAIENLSPQNRPSAIKADYESRCIGKHINNFKVIIEPKRLPSSSKETLVSLASEHGIDIMFLGSFGTKGKTEMLGSSADLAIRKAPCSIAIVRNSSTLNDEPKRFLLCADGSAAVNKGFEQIAHVMKSCDTLTVLHIASQQITPDGETRFQENSIRKLFDKQITAAGICASFVSMPNQDGISVGDQIINYSNDHNMDFVCIGTDGVSAHLKKQQMIGSVTERVINSCQATTITFRMHSVYASFEYGNYDKCFAGW